MQCTWKPERALEPLKQKLQTCERHVALETEPRSSAKLQGLLTTEPPLQPLWERVQSESQRLWSQATWT